MDIALTISNRQISPAVVNLFQFENGTTTLNFTLDSYMYGEVNLRNYKAYAITSINGNIDMTELVANYDASKDKLTLSWDVKEFTLLEAGAVVYQIVFKEANTSGIPDEGENTSVFYSYKAILINRESIDADNEIAAKYPTILKQWLDRMNAMAELHDVGTVYMKYGESILPADRLAGKLYFQYTDTLNTRGHFEDEKGNILGEYDVVHLVGNESISGEKTFTISPKVPTPAAGDNSTKIATTAFVNTKAANFLPLAGGTITGSLTLQNNSAVLKDTQNTLSPTADAWHKGHISFYDKNNTRVGFIQPMFKSDGSVEFRLVVVHPTNGNKYLNLGSNGALTWNGKDVITSAGGTITGLIKTSVGDFIAKTTDDSYLCLVGATNSSNGARIVLSGKDRSGNGGVFSIVARDATAEKVLSGRPDGTLQWDNKYVLNNSFSMPTTTSGIVLNGGPDYESGAYMRVYGKEHAQYPGWFTLGASDGTNASALRGSPDGTLTWNTNPIAVVKSMAKSKNGHIKIGDLIIQWGRVDSINGSSYTSVTLPTAFSHSDYAVVTSSSTGDGSGQSGMMFAFDKTTTNFKIDNSNKSYTDSAQWIAIGW